MRLTEQQYNEILKKPIGVGTFIYRRAQCEVAQLIATRTGVIAYHPKTLKKLKQQKTKSQPKPSYEPLLKIFVIVAIGLIIFLTGAS